MPISKLNISSRHRPAYNARENFSTIFTAGPDSAGTCLQYEDPTDTKNEKNLAERLKTLEVRQTNYTFDSRDIDALQTRIQKRLFERSLLSNMRQANRILISGSMQLNEGQHPACITPPEFKGPILHNYFMTRSAVSETARERLKSLASTVLTHGSDGGSLHRASASLHNIVSECLSDGESFRDPIFDRRGTQRGVIDIHQVPIALQDGAYELGRLLITCPNGTPLYFVSIRQLDHISVVILRSNRPQDTYFSETNKSPSDGTIKSSEMAELSRSLSVAKETANQLSSQKARLTENTEGQEGLVRDLTNSLASFHFAQAMTESTPTKINEPALDETQNRPTYEGHSGSTNSFEKTKLNISQFSKLADAKIDILISIAEHTRNASKPILSYSDREGLSLDVENLSTWVKNNLGSS